MPKAPSPAATLGRRQREKAGIDTAPTQARGPRTFHNALLLPIDQVEPDPTQPRRTFDDEALGELRDSIAQHGVLQPLIVREDGLLTDRRTRYSIIAGERRWRAAQAAGLTVVPAVVRDISPDQDAHEIRVLQLIENLQREVLNPVEEAESLRDLRALRGLSIRDLASLIGRAPNYVQRRLDLLLDERLTAAVASGRLKATTAGEIGTLPAAAREDVVARVQADPDYTPDVATLRGVKRQERARRPGSPRPQGATVPAALPADTRPGLAEGLPASSIDMLPVLQQYSPESPTDGVDGLDTALRWLHSEALESVITYGVERGWSCQDLLQAIQERRSRTATGTDDCFP